MSKLVRRYVAETADAIASAGLAVLMAVGLVRIPEPIRVRVTATRRR